jgi:hypothetical protein
VDVIYAHATANESTSKSLITEVRDALEKQGAQASPFAVYQAADAPGKKGLLIESTEAASVRVLAIETVD